MTPEERANALAAGLVDQSGLHPRHSSWLFSDPTIEFVASAIREAENAALERAYREVATLALMADGNQSQDFLNGLSVASDRIKSMKGEGA